jgi:MYXO-CTERM domain-containing protein
MGGGGTSRAFQVWAAALCVWLSPPAWADVAFEAASSAGGSGGSLSFAHTVGTGANRFLLVAVALEPAGASVSSASHGGKALSRLGNRAASTCKTELWGLAAPASGSHTVQVSFSGSPSSVAVGATSYTGVDPRDPTGNFASHSGSGGGPQSLSVSVAIQAGDYTVDVLCGASNAGAPNPSVGALQTQRWRRSNGTLTGVGSSQPNITSDGRATMSWTLDGPGTIDWSISTVPLNPAPPPPPPDAGPDLAPDVAPDLAPDVSADLPPDLAEPDLAADLPGEDAAPDAEADAGVVRDAAEEDAGPDLPPEEEDAASGMVDVNLKVGCACRAGGRAGGAWPALLLVGLLLRRRALPRTRRCVTTDPWRTPRR